MRSTKQCFNWSHNVQLVAIAGPSTNKLNDRFGNTCLGQRSGTSFAKRMPKEFLLVKTKSSQQMASDFNDNVTSHRLMVGLRLHKQRSIEMWCLLRRVEHGMDTQVREHGLDRHSVPNSNGNGFSKWIGFGSSKCNGHVGDLIEQVWRLDVNLAPIFFHQLDLLQSQELEWIAVFGSGCMGCELTHAQQTICGKRSSGKEKRRGERVIEQTFHLSKYVSGDGTTNHFGCTCKTLDTLPTSIDQRFVLEQITKTQLFVQRANGRKIGSQRTWSKRTCGTSGRMSEPEHQGHLGGGEWSFLAVGSEAIGIAIESSLVRETGRGSQTIENKVIGSIYQS